MILLTGTSTRPRLHMAEMVLKVTIMMMRATALVSLYLKCLTDSHMIVGLFSWIQMGASESITRARMGSGKNLYTSTRYWVFQSHFGCRRGTGARVVLCTVTLLTTNNHTFSAACFRFPFSLNELIPCRHWCSRIRSRWGYLYGLNPVPGAVALGPHRELEPLSPHRAVARPKGPIPRSIRIRHPDLQQSNIVVSRSPDSNWQYTSILPHFSLPAYPNSSRTTTILSRNL